MMTPRGAIPTLAPLVPLTLALACAGAKPEPAPADSSCPMVCPELAGMPCHIGLDAAAAYDYCDVCGVSWRCELTGTEPRDFLYWSASDVPCACITAAGGRDTAVAGCGGEGSN